MYTINKKDYGTSKEWLGLRAGVAYAALSEYHTIIIEYGEDTEENQRRIEALEDMMKPLEVLLGVLYPNEMQD